MTDPAMPPWGANSHRGYFKENRKKKIVNLKYDKSAILDTIFVTFRSAQSWHFLAAMHSVR